MPSLSKLIFLNDNSNKLASPVAQIQVGFELIIIHLHTCVYVHTCAKAVKSTLKPFLTNHHTEILSSKF